MKTAQLNNWYQQNFEKSLFGKQIVHNDIAPLLKLNDKQFVQSKIGVSENGTPIYSLKTGTGKIKVLLWSQMHGNESTGTKAMFDIFNFFKAPGELKNEAQQILNACTLLFIPMLNPDGSELFTRENVNKIDLNRDAVHLQALESKILNTTLKSFNPKFCFNLHDQRTIFNVEGTKNPASISFLAPSEEETRTLTPGRKETMSVIVAMNSLLQKIIPNHIGRYTDEYYPNATGDNFQKAGYNTILIEAGHYHNDYDREHVRKFNFFAMLQGLLFISKGNYSNYKPYFDIPNNDTKCFDVIERAAENEDGTIEDIAYQYHYEVLNGKLTSKKIEMKRGNLIDFIGHNETDFNH